MMSKKKLLIALIGIALVAIALKKRR
jgi:hypothetical protein